MDFMKEYEKWLASPALSAQEKAELEAILPEIHLRRRERPGRQGSRLL